MDTLSHWRSRGLRVTELSQQLWCEKKVELELLYGKEETLPMKKGRERHRELFEEITPVIIVEPETKIDEVFVVCYQMWLLSLMALTEGRAREIPVFGHAGSAFLKGVIDEVVIRDGRSRIVETKTRVSGEVPEYTAYERVVEFQISLYKYMLDEIRKGHFTFHDVIKFYKIEPDTVISETLFKSLPEGITPHVQSMITTAFDALRTLPETAERMVVKYENQKRDPIGEKEFIFDGENMQKNIDFVMKYWEGTRSAVPPLKNLWKCRYCSEVLRSKCDAYQFHLSDPDFV